jgi:hypothetical protein
MCNGDLVGGFVGGDALIDASESSFKEKLFEIVARRRLRNQHLLDAIYFCDACAALLREVTLCEVQLEALHAGVRGVFGSAEEKRLNARASSHSSGSPVSSMLCAASCALFHTVIHLDSGTLVPR